MAGEVRFAERSGAWIEVYVGAETAGSLFLRADGAAKHGDPWTASRGLLAWLAARSMHGEDRSVEEWRDAIEGAAQSAFL